MNGCDRYDDALVELALGTVAVEDRAAVLEHVTTCRACDARLAQHTRTVDDFLAIVPEAEPPAGFESRVLAAFPRGRHPARRRRRARLLAAAAAVTVLAAGTAVGVLGALRATQDDRAAGRAYRADLAEAGGRYFGAYRLTPAVPGARGVVFGYDGDPSWVVVTAEGVDADGRVVVEGASTTVTGALDARSSWGGALPFPLGDIRHVRVEAADGTTVLRFHPEAAG